MKTFLLFLFFLFTPLYSASANTGTLWIPCSAPILDGDSITLSMRPSTTVSGKVLNLSTESDQRSLLITSDVPYTISGVCRGALGIVSYDYPGAISFYDFSCSAFTNKKANEIVQGLVGVVCAALLWSAIILGMRS